MISTVCKRCRERFHPDHFAAKVCDSCQDSLVYWITMALVLAVALYMLWQGLR